MRAYFYYFCRRCLHNHIYVPYLLWHASNIRYLRNHTAEPTKSVLIALLLNLQLLTDRANDRHSDGQPKLKIDILQLYNTLRLRLHYFLHRWLKNPDNVNILHAFLLFLISDISRVLVNQTSKKTWCIAAVTGRFISNICWIPRCSHCMASWQYGWRLTLLRDSQKRMSGLLFIFWISLHISPEGTIFTFRVKI